MEGFRYTARDTSGMQRQGIRHATTVKEVLDWLQLQGYTPVSVDEIAASKAQKRFIPKRKHVSSSDIATFCWQLSTMLKGGITVPVALESIAGDLDNFYFRDVMMDVLETMREGETLSTSIAKYPKIFNTLFHSMIVAGEMGGTLTDATQRLAEYYDNRDKLQKQLKQATAYPIFVFSFVVLLLAFMMAFIIPRFVELFDDFGGTLPAFTRGFMAFYDFTCSHIISILMFTAMFVAFCIMAYRRTDRGHRFFSRLILRLPVFGKIYSNAFVALFCRTMSTLLTAGVSILDALDILSGMTPNDVIKDAILQTKQYIVEGSNISMGMAASGFFPNMVITMVQSGEQSGSLQTTLDRTTVFFERKVEVLVKTLMSLLEPLMIVLVGGIVLVIVLALYLPIFGMSSAIGGN